MTNHTSELKLENLERFTPTLDGLRLYIFTGTGILVVGIAIVIQRAVYKSLKRLGSRPINQIIIPSMVRLLTVSFLKGQH